jgi:Bacterial capsule synthesis protein PGA_cap
MSVNAWRGDHPLDGFESKSEHVTMSISTEQISTEPITRQVARLFLCGDVMTGRGIDQILPHPCDPLLHESYVKSARDYIRLAEQVNGRIPKAVKFSYVWGAALQELTHAQPDVRIINLETSITRRGAFVPKGINYRMSPERRLSRVCRYRLLCARQQPYFRLGACWAGRHAGKSGASADRVSGSRA